MLRYALLFLMIAIIAGVMGFGNLEGLSMNIAWILLVIFVILLIVSVIMGRGSPRV